MDKEAAKHQLNSSNGLRGVGSRVKRRPSRDDGWKDLSEHYWTQVQAKETNISKALSGVIGKVVCAFSAV